MAFRIDEKHLFTSVLARESVGSGKAPSFLAAGSGGGGSSGPIKSSDHHAQHHGAEFPPVATWDFNWDKRQPEAVVKPPPPVPGGGGVNSLQQVEDYHEKIAKATPSAARVLILVRHGQYNLSGSQDSERYLTELGREQADLTGHRLAQLVNHYNSTKKYDLSLVMSSMTRATETANIIAKHLETSAAESAESCSLIREGAPCEPVPSASSVWDPDPHQFFEEGARIEAGFRKYFHRADPSQKDNSVQILVCHGNVIRYFVCRALQLPPQVLS